MLLPLQVSDDFKTKINAFNFRNYKITNIS